VGSRLRAGWAVLADFVLGDDWRIALAVATGLALTWAVSRTSLPAWWLLPVLVVAVLPVSLWWAIRRR